MGDWYGVHDRGDTVILGLLPPAAPRVAVQQLKALGLGSLMPGLLYIVAEAGKEFQLSSDPVGPPITDQRGSPRWFPNDPEYFRRY